MKKWALKNLKLQLNRETLRALEQSDLSGVAGGLTFFQKTCADITCPIANTCHTC
jgi:hypothetical protein